jgi:predicted dienelactone hydrolase
MPWERAKDLKAVLDHLQTDPTLRSKIDFNRVGAAGYSAGGATVIQLLGGQYNQKKIEQYCLSPQSEGDGTCEPRAAIARSTALVEALARTDPVVTSAMRNQGGDQRDGRIRAAFLMAPAIGPAFSRTTLRRINRPVLIVGGDADVVAPPRTNATWYARSIHGARLSIIRGAGHQVFSSVCTAGGIRNLDSCKDPPGVDRTQVQDHVAAAALDFFDAVLSRP